eukprot:6183835-Pleurochrysis_carterae.AAC.1
MVERSTLPSRVEAHAARWEMATPAKVFAAKGARCSKWKKSNVKRAVNDSVHRQTPRKEEQKEF